MLFGNHAVLEQIVRLTGMIDLMGVATLGKIGGITEMTAHGAFFFSTTCNIGAALIETFILA